MLSGHSDPSPYRRPLEPRRGDPRPVNGRTVLPTVPAWSRRRAIAAMAAGILGSAGVVANTPMIPAASARDRTAARPLAIGDTSPEAITFVLVHGGWHGGWSWSRVSPLLRAAGHHVWVPTLTGLADRAHLLTAEIGLETHIRDIVGLLEYEELERVVLVGHSYAGMVITGVAALAPERLSHLVYLDAFVPTEGDTLLSLLPPDRQAFYREQAATRGDGWRVPPPPVAALGVTNMVDLAWLEAKLTDQPLRSFEQPLARNAPTALPRTYIHCTEGPIAASFAPFASRAQAESGWRYHELATGHDAMILVPEDLTELLLGVASDGA